MTTFAHPLPPRAEVCLVQMPYSALERPSIALAILKSALTRAGIGCRVLYGNLAFAEEVGVFVQNLISKSLSHELAGEWTFAAAAFPELETDEQAYLDQIAVGLECLTPLLRLWGGRGHPRGILCNLRRLAPSFVDRMAERVLSLQPRIVGATSTFQQHTASLALLRRLKQLEPSIITVMGGANCEASMGVVTHQYAPWVDYVMSGEGELVFTELCTLLLREGGGPQQAAALLPRGLIGPAVREAQAANRTSLSVIGGGARPRAGQDHRELRLAPPRAVVEDMSRSPVPDYDDYYAALATSPARHFVSSGLLLESSRGCWWGAKSHCTFCGLNGTSLDQRTKPASRIYDEIDLLSRRHGAETFELVDNILDMKYFGTLLPQLSARQPPVTLFYETKANLSRKHVAQLASAGIRWIQPGIESLDDELLALVNKGTTALQNVQLLRWTREYGIYVIWLMLYDIPLESAEPYERMSRWLPLISHLQPPTNISYIQYNRFSPYWSRAADYGLELTPDRSYAGVYPWPADALVDFAYYFDDYRGRREHFGMGPEAVQSPHLQRFGQAVDEWRTQWVAAMDRIHETPEIRAAVPQLWLEDDGKRTVVYDTRRCRSAGEHTLEGVARRVLLACDRMTATGSLHGRLEPEGVASSAIGDALELLGARGLVLSMGDKHLALPTFARPRPLPDPTAHPGGRLRTLEEATHAELEEHAMRMVEDLALP